MTTQDNPEAWIRDYDADANQDLVRKRPRKDDESSISPRSSSNGSVVIEAIESAPLGTSFDNAIQLYDDPVMESYGESFNLPGANLNPKQQLDRLARKIEAGHCIEPQIWISMTGWLRDHLNATVDDAITWRAAYPQEQDFFAHLGEVLFFMLARQERIIDAHLTSDTAHRLREAIELLFTSLTSLSIRMLLCLPSIVESTVSRRDSANLSAPRYRIHLLCYVQILAQMLSSRRIPASYCFQECLGFSPEATAESCRAIFMQQPSAKTSLISLLKLLGHVHAEVADAWESIDAILWLVRRPELQLREELEVVLETAQVRLLPVVCERHPRTLPDGFLENFIGTSSWAVKTLIQLNDVDGASSIYLRYIRGEDDALLPESAGTSSIPALLSSLADTHQGLLAKLMTTAWVLQALKRLIFSDIMDVRSQGVNLLSYRLRKNYTRHRDLHAEGEHPVLQYIARFMRVNELTKYILGPNSHASLVNHSQDIVGFLAVSGAFTELEADIIWHACTTSVEAEFVRASFGILNALYRWLSMNHLRYFAQKYISTPLSRIGRDAVDSLYGLLNQMIVIANQADDQEVRLTHPFTCISILKHVTNSPDAPCSDSLSMITRSGLGEFARTRIYHEDRIQIYTACVSDVLDQTQNATTSIEILLLFLRKKPTLEEAQWIRANLPTDALSSELVQFVGNLPTTSEGLDSSILIALDLRIELMFRLLALQPAAAIVTDGNFLHTFYRHIVGDKANHNDAREAAWIAFYRLRSMDSIRHVASEVVHRFVVRDAMDLPPENITPALVKFWNQILLDSLSNAEDDVAADFLSMPLWHKLLETAEGCTIAASHQLAIEAICQLLLFQPLHAIRTDSSSSFDAKFIDRQVDRLCLQYQTFVRSKQSEDHGKVVRSIDILDAVLSKSRLPSHIIRNQSDTRLDLAGEADEDTLSCTLHVCGTANIFEEVDVRITAATTVHDLVSRLPDITGCAEHQIVVAERPIDLEKEANISLSQLGVAGPGVISISPKHSFSTDIEQQILAHFRELEVLLTGSELVSEKMYRFLAKISPPNVARARSMAAGITTDAIFPPSHAWQSIYYVFVLKNQLQDLLQNGIVDEGFFVQSVRHLVTVLVDDKWPVKPDLHLRVMECLVCFLENCADKLPSESLLVEDAKLVTSRMIKLCCDMASGTIDVQPSARVPLVNNAFLCLVLLSRNQESVWRSFVQHDRFVDLHKILLLSSERALSADAASTIREFCLKLEKMDDTEDVYLNVLIGMLPDALCYGYMSIDYFVVTTDAIVANKSIQTNEARAREIIQMITAQLWSYEHSESVDLPLVDPAIAGLLNILAGALRVLKGFEKPLKLAGLPSLLFKRFLFPRLDDADSKLLVDPATRRLVYDTVKSTCQSMDEYVDLMDGAITPLYDASHDPSATYPGRAGWLRNAADCSGLTNLGMTCYMNSLLQQLFSNINFRRFIFDTAVHNPKEQSFLSEVQKLFSNMQDEYCVMTDTTALARNLGTQIENQEDVHGFYEDFLSRLEVNMPDEMSKMKLSRFFSGKLISQIKGECGHVSPKSEPFVDLPIVVKNKSSLQDSLDEFVQGEPMEGTNKYRCQACEPTGGGRLVNAMKRTCLEELPENVTFCLKRFTFEAMLGLDGKVNDRFEFPETIDLSRYLRACLEDPSAEVPPDVFELVGVIVHQGTLQIGHYWSYTLLRSSRGQDDRNWVKLEDGNALPVKDITEVQRECFGGQILSNGNPRSDNAYVLFYQRKSDLDGQIAKAGNCLFDPGVLLPPKVAVPAALKRQIHETNGWRQRIAHLFDDDFAATVKEVLERLYQHLAAPKPSSKIDDSHSENESSEALMQLNSPPDDNLLDKISELGMTYLLRVATCDIRAPQKVDAVLDKLRSILNHQPALANKLLICFFENRVPFQGVMAHQNETVRSQISGFILQCMSCLRHQDRASYDGMLLRIQIVLETVLGSVEELSRVHWPSLFGFTAKLAHIGVEATRAILGIDALTWSFEVLHLQCDNIAAEKSHRMLELVQHSPSRISALYLFIADMLSSHVDLSEGPNNSGSHSAGNDDVLPRVTEVKYLTSRECDGVLSWIWISKFAEVKRDWRDFAPGKIIALILNNEALEHLVPDVEAALQRHNEKEDNNLNALLHLTLRFCVEAGQSPGASKVFNALVRTFPEWERTADVLAFMDQAYALVPETAVQSIHEWCEYYLVHKHRKVQQHAEQWLQDAVFQPEPLLDNSVLDAHRVRQIRKLVKGSCALLRDAYDEEKPQAKYEVLINVLRSAASYIKALRDGVRKHLESPDGELRARVGAELRVEYDESASCLTDLEDVLRYLADWVPDDGMLISPLDHVSQSIETVSEDAETSEEETWDDDTEQVHS